MEEVPSRIEEDRETIVRRQKKFGESSDADTSDAAHKAMRRARFSAAASRSRSRMGVEDSVMAERRAKFAAESNVADDLVLPDYRDLKDYFPSSRRTGHKERGRIAHTSSNGDGYIWLIPCHRLYFSQGDILGDLVAQVGDRVECILDHDGYGYRATKIRVLSQSERPDWQIQPDHAWYRWPGAEWAELEQERYGYQRGGRRPRENRERSPPRFNREDYEGGGGGRRSRSRSPRRRDYMDESDEDLESSRRSRRSRRTGSTDSSSRRSSRGTRGSRSGRSMSTMYSDFPDPDDSEPRLRSSVAEYTV